MEFVVLQANVLNLPTIFATKLSGNKVEILERDNAIEIKPGRI